MPKNWNSRVTSSANVDPATLLAHPDNIVIHTDEQMAEMRKLLRTVGWAAAVLVSQRAGRIIDGHMRVAIAVADGLKTVPVDYVDLTEEEETKAIVYLRRTTSFARLDPINLEVVLNSIHIDDDEIGAMMRAFEQEAGILAKREREKPRELVESVDVVVGPITFQVTWPEYVHWRGQLQFLYRTRHDTLCFAVRARLGLVQADLPK